MVILLLLFVVIDFVTSGEHSVGLNVRETAGLTRDSEWYENLTRAEPGTENDTTTDSETSSGNFTKMSSGNLSREFRNDAENRDREIFQTVSFVCGAVINPILISVGILGNSLVLSVLLRCYLKSPSTPYFVGLFISDLTLLIFSSPGVLSTYDSVTRTIQWKTVYSFYIAYFYPLVGISYTVGIWITLSFTIERYIVICHPLKAQKFCTVRRIKITVGFVYVFGFLLNCARFFRRYPVLTRDPETKETFYQSAFTDVAFDPVYTSFNFFSAFVANHLIPFPVMAVLNILIIRQVSSAQKQRSQLTGTPAVKSSDHQITRILLGIVAVFFFCNICSAVANVVVALLGTSVYGSWTFRTFLATTNMMATANSVVNCVLYAFCSRRIRRDVVGIFCACCRSNPDPAISRTPGINSGTQGTRT